MSAAGHLPHRVLLAPSVRVRIGPRQGFVFDERSGRVYSLSATSALAAARLREEVSPDEVIGAIVDAFAVDEATVRRDLIAFIDQLVREGLARPVDGAPDESSPRGRR